MTIVKIKLDLPDALAQELSRMGLLEPNVLQRIVRNEVRARRLARLAEARRNVAGAGLPPLTMEDINVEILADRAALGTETDNGQPLTTHRP